MADSRFAQPAAGIPPPRFGPEEQSSLFQAAPGAFENMYKLPKAVPTPEPAAEEPEVSSNMRMFGSEDPAKAYLEQFPLPRFVQAMDRFKEKTMKRIGEYVQEHPEDSDLLAPAPLSAWAKSIGVGLAKMPLRVLQGAAKVTDFIDPTKKIIPESQMHIPSVEDTVLQIAAGLGLPLEDAKARSAERPTLLKSLHDSFVVPVKDGFQIAMMPNGKEKQEALDAWAYQTASKFTSGLTVGVVDQAIRENAVSLEGGELVWKGVPITDLTELENKGVSAGGITGQLSGGLVTYALVSPMLTEGLRNVQALDAMYKAHPYASSAILTNAAQEGFEAVVRKADGQPYGFNDTLIGMMSGLVFETGKLAMGGYKVNAEAPDVDIEAVRDFVDAEVRDYTAKNGHVPDVNDLRAQMGDKVIPGTQMTVNQLHEMMARSGIKESRLIELKGGKKGRPGMDFEAEPPAPKPEPEGGGKLPDPADHAGVLDYSSKVLGTTPEELSAVVREAGENLDTIKATLTKKFGDKFTSHMDEMAKAVENGDADLGAVDFVDPIRRAVFSDAVAALPEEGNFNLRQFDSSDSAKVMESPSGKAIVTAITDAGGNVDDAMKAAAMFGQGKMKDANIHGQSAITVEQNFTIPKVSVEDLASGKVTEIAGIKIDPESVAEVLKEGKTGIFGKVKEPVQIFYDVETGQPTLQNGYHRLVEMINRGGGELSGQISFGKNPKGQFFTSGLGTRFAAPEGEATTPRFAKGQVDQVFRTDKFNVDEAGIARLKNVQETLGLTKRGVRAWTDVEKMAKEIGADPMELMRRVTKKTQLTDVEVEALRQNVQSAHEYLAKKYDLIEAAQKNGDTAAVRQIEAKAKMSEQIINDSVKKLIGGGTELGRGVAIYRKIAAMKMDDPTYFYKEAAKLLEDGRRKVRFNGKSVDVEDGKLPTELRQAIDSLMESRDQLGLSYLMSQLKKTNNWDKVVHLWKAGLLTSPTTDLANILGNTTMMALETIKDAPAALTDILLTKGAQASNKLFGTSFDTTRVKTLSTKMMKKQFVGLYEGGGRAVDYFKTGIDPDDLMGKYDVHKAVNYNNVIAQKYTEFIFRKLGAEDLVFRYGFLRKSLMESAELAVKNMDRAELKNAMELLPEGVPRTKNELVKFLYQNPSDEASVRAINEAEYGTFQRHNALTDMISGGKQATTPVVRAAAEFVTPFTRTPTNIGLTIWDYTPAGFVTEMARQLKSPDKLRIVNSVGRGMLGTSVMALGAALHKEGLMTGNAPETESERKLWEAERKTPNSVFFMGKWRRLDKISPIGNLMTLGAEFDELGQKKTAIEQWTQIGFEGVKSVTDQSFLLGLSNALKAVTEPDRFAATFVENAVRGLVPSILARIGRGTDDYERETGTMNIPAVLAERIPFLRETLPERMDVLGRKIKTQGGLIGNMFDPFSSRKPSENPVVNELSRLEQPISAPNGSLYSDEEYQQLIELRGTMLMQILDNMMDDDQYKLMPDELKREAIKTIDAAVTREAHSGMRMAMAVRIQKELSEMSPSDKEKKMNEIKKKNSTVYMILQLLDATQPIDGNRR